jgi:hypothetical protein
MQCGPVNRVYRGYDIFRHRTKLLIHLVKELLHTPCLQLLSHGIVDKGRDPPWTGDGS